MQSITKKKKYIILVCVFLILLLTYIIFISFLKYIDKDSNLYKIYYHERLLEFKRECGEFPKSMTAITNNEYKDCLEDKKLISLPQSLKSNELKYINDSEYVFVIYKGSVIIKLKNN